MEQLSASNPLMTRIRFSSALVPAKTILGGIFATNQSTSLSLREDHFGDSGYRKNRSARPQSAESTHQGDELLSNRRQRGPAPPRDRDFDWRYGLDKTARLDPIAF